MITVNLYKYEKDNGVVVITPNAESLIDAPYKVRLIAEENAVLTNGEIETPAIDIGFDEVDSWSEINGADAATEEDYLQALSVLGVE